MSFPMYYAFEGAEPPARAGAAHATIYPYGPFPAGDGGTVMLGVQNDREWAVFCKQVLECPQLLDDARFTTTSLRVANRDALRAAIVEAFATLTAEEVVDRLEAAQIANAHVNDMHGLWSHPQLKARDSWREIDSPVGQLPAMLPPGRNSAFAPRMDAVPGLGEHTDSLLAELGYAPADIQRLHDSGAV
ncbi:Formyl-CoA:oxalate CoA-transferase [compost metagenome]